MVALHERPGLQQEIDPAAQIAHENRLMQLARSDLSAFGGIFETYYPRVCSFFISATRDQDTADDLASTTFEKALRRIASYDQNKGTVAGWLFQIAKNSLIDEMRKKSNHKTDSMNVHPEIQKLPNDSVPGNLQKTIEAKELVNSVNHGLSKLTRKQREVVLLRLTTNMSNLEIGKKLGLKEGAVKSLLSRALPKIRESVKEEIEA